MNDHDAETIPIQPILVILVWRGGARLKRALDSLRDTEKYFKRVVISITSDPDSDDVREARKFASQMSSGGHPTKIEIICTGIELPTMKHQLFWISYLEKTGARKDDWIFWLAYDDELRSQGISELVDQRGNWPLTPNTVYLGPWSIRHETSNELWSQNTGEEEEVWTCLTRESKQLIPVYEWMSQQLLQPTYIQMSGSVAHLECHSRLVKTWPKKRGPMRIEMATAAHFNVRNVAEFATPVTIIYGRSDSDRSMYGRAAYWEDLNLFFQVLRDFPKAQRSIAPLVNAAGRRLLQMVTRTNITEEWRTR